MNPKNQQEIVDLYSKNILPEDLCVESELFPFAQFIFRKYSTGTKVLNWYHNVQEEILDYLDSKAIKLWEESFISRHNVKVCKFVIFFYRDMLVKYYKAPSGPDNFISFYIPSTRDFEGLNEFDQFIIPPVVIQKKDNAKISILLPSPYGGPSFFPFGTKLPKIDIGLNYGKDFIDIDKKVREKLENKSAGLYIFHGPPGTGKSTYIKYLSSIIDREVLLIPNNMGHVLETPDFLKLLLSKKGAVIVIEDAEKIILDREVHINSPVSSILNLTDGFLGDLLNISIIVTFNCAKESIDKALLRKGRLAIDYKFDLLSMEDSEFLVKKIGSKHIVKKPMSLAEIFNLEDQITPIIEQKAEVSAEEVDFEDEGDIL